MKILPSTFLAQCPVKVRIRYVNFEKPEMRKWDIKRLKWVVYSIACEENGKPEMTPRDGSGPSGG